MEMMYDEYLVVQLPRTLKRSASVNRTEIKQSIKHWADRSELIWPLCAPIIAHVEAREAVNELFLVLRGDAECVSVSQRTVRHRCRKSM